MIRSNISNFPVADVEISSLPPDQTIKFVLSFLETSLPGFCTKYLDMFSSLSLAERKEAQWEDKISEKLILHWQAIAKKNDLLFLFQEKKGVDFVFLVVELMTMPPKPIFMVEAKRLSSNHRDYVQGRTGGIERFKREQVGFVFEGSHCAMVAYVQQHDFDYWFNRINQWLTDLIANNEKYDEYDWEESDKLIAITSSSAEVARYLSYHSRKTLPKLTLNHFWLDMRVDNPT